MLFSRQIIYLVAVLCHVALCTIPAPKYDGNKYVDMITTDDLIGGVYVGGGKDMDYGDMGQLAKDARIHAIDIGIALNLPKLSYGVTVYINANKDLVIAAVGGGSNNHGERNVQILCNTFGVDFDLGKIVTYYPARGGFIRACDEGDINTQDCVSLLGRYGIKDVNKDVKKADPDQ